MRIALGILAFVAAVMGTNSLMGLVTGPSDVDAISGNYDSFCQAVAVMVASALVMITLAFAVIPFVASRDLRFRKRRGELVGVGWALVAVAVINGVHQASWSTLSCTAMAADHGTMYKVIGLLNVAFALYICGQAAVAALNPSKE